ncbi:Kinase interacting-like family protein [Prunus dulcis]|uniref:Kinase interacting-like family protein n=1 Tax=Prunus dulcis TaxID=3755 RepID=A0A4Y1RJX6_PRUDU|nr:Kinase interacting-like family protein [Prunus dulcis]
MSGCSFHHRDLSSLPLSLQSAIAKLKGYLSKVQYNKTMKRTESRKSHSWWWDSHISPKNSKWLPENLEVNFSPKCLSRK